MHERKDLVRAMQHLPPGARLAHVMCAPPALEFPTLMADAATDACPPGSQWQPPLQQGDDPDCEYDHGKQYQHSV